MNIILRVVLASVLCALVLTDEISAQQTDIDKARLHYRIGVKALDNDDPKTARDEFREAARLTPNNALIWYNLAMVQAGLKESKDALDSLRRAMDLGLPQEKKDAAEELLASLIYETRPRSLSECPPAEFPLTSEDGSIRQLTPEHVINAVGSIDRLIDNLRKAVSRLESATDDLSRVRLARVRAQIAYLECRRAVQK